VRIRRATVHPADGTAGTPITVCTPVAIEVEYWNLQPDAYLNLSLHIYNEQGIMAFNALPVKEGEWQGRPFPTGLFRDICYIPGDFLNDGMYWVELLIVQDESTLIYQQHEILVFDVLDEAKWRGAWHGKWPGAVRPIFEWQTQLVERL
jgi:lipopolysaccharide transport system ATP-binding protein